MEKRLRTEVDQREPDDYELMGSALPLRQHSDDEDTANLNEELLEEFEPEVLTVRVPLSVPNEHRTLSASKLKASQSQAAAMYLRKSTNNGANQEQMTVQGRLVTTRLLKDANRQLGSPQITREMTVA